MVPIRTVPTGTADNARQVLKKGSAHMLELASYGLTGLAAILLVAFCFACKDEFASFGEGPSSSPICDAGLRHPKLVERCTGATDGNTRPQDQKGNGTFHG